jgi:hypothetical protein
MRRVVLNIFIYAILITSIIAEETIIYIETNRDESKIYLNDDLIGIGNVIVKLEPGDYFISVREDSRKWNSQIISDSISISADDKSKKLTYEFSERIFLDTYPQDSRIYNGDSLIGKTPILLDDSFNKLRIQKNNFSEKKINLNEVNSGEAIKLDFTGSEDTGTFVGSGLFWTLVGSAVALGSTAVYHKIKADKNYEKYLDTGDRSFLDKTERQDLVSGISFGALQLNLAALVYFVLSE